MIINFFCSFFGTYIFKMLHLLWIFFLYINKLCVNLHDNFRNFHKKKSVQCYFFEEIVCTFFTFSTSRGCTENIFKYDFFSRKILKNKKVEHFKDMGSQKATKNQFFAKHRRVWQAKNSMKKTKLTLYVLCKRRKKVAFTSLGW